MGIAFEVSGFIRALYFVVLSIDVREMVLGKGLKRKR